jgi:excisionase family DNA binding protein
MERRRLWTTKEASVYLGVGENYIRDMIMEGDRDFPYINITRGEKAAFRFDEEDLAAWVNNQKRIANVPLERPPLFGEECVISEPPKEEPDSKE